MANHKKTKLLNYVGFMSFLILIGLFLSALSLYQISHSSIGITDSDKYFMKIAYEEAVLASKSEDAIVGAVLVIDGKIIAKAHNEVKLKKDYRDHAEMLAINEALNILNISNFGQINGGVTLYTTYEPCSMCEGFIVATKVNRVVVGKRKSFITLLKQNFIGHILYRLNERGCLTR
jgi:tRNA(adenine34) deaminase